MNETIHKYHRLYLIGFFLILALPILNLSPWFSPPDWGKTVVFKIIFSILIFLFIWQILSEKKFSIKTSLPLWLLFALFGVFLLATISSQDPIYSLLGDPHRAGGFLNFSFYIFFAVLAFLILRKQDWRKIWLFTIFIGVFVSIIAVFQQYKTLTKIFVPVEGRPFSFVGSSVLLGLYLVLLVFITLSFFLKEKEIKKKLFYFSALSLFLYVILLTGSRAAYFGLLIGFIYFIFAWQKSFFPLKKKNLLSSLKILFLILLIISAYGVYYINTHPKLPSYLQESKTFQGFSNRLSINLILEDPRFSAWAISVEAIKERPILGYGPENFSIAFDKHYDPSLPYITKAWGNWYDKAHNFLFDIAVTAGIPALIIFISLFAVLFYKLQKVKYNPDNPNAIITHGIQATFLAYFANNLFVFDTFSSYLVLFLLIAYSLSLTTQSKKSAIAEKTEGVKYKKMIILALFVCLIWFIWSLNLKPLIINKQANIALQSKDENCEQALAQIEKLLSSHSFLDHYLGIKYVNIVNACIKKEPSKSIEIAQNVISVLKKNTKIRPAYTRNWLYLGIYANFLIEKGLASVDEADYYFAKAQEISPKRQEIFDEWAKTYFITNEYLRAKEKAQKCIELNPFAIIGECWWTKGLCNIYLGNIKQSKIDLQAAKEKKYDTESKTSLLQLVEAYLETENYEELIEVHEKLIKLEPDNAQYYATLAYNYKVIGNYEKAEETAEKMLELFPEMKEKVEEFLKTLPNH